MSYTAIVCRLTQIRPHPKADRIQLATVLGNQVVVGLNSKDEDLGIFFPTDGVLSHEFAEANNLYNQSARNALGLKSPEGQKLGFFDHHRRVRAQKFRGEKSDGFWLELNCLENFGFTDHLKEGDQLTELGGHVFCEKWYNPKTLRALQGQQKKTKKDSIYFPKHIDTTQFRFVAETLPEDGVYYITEKLHGTSGRYGLVPDEVPLSRWKQFLNAHVFRSGYFKPAQEWSYLNGSRQVILEKTAGEGYYGTNEFRYAAVRDLTLRKGEILFFELVGWVAENTPIMPNHDSTKLEDKKFTSKFGSTIPYTYGCPNGTSRLFLYKISHVNEDGIVTEQPWSEVVRRARELGLATVPLLSGPITSDSLKRKWSTESFHEALRHEVENWTAMQESMLSPLQVKEGVVLRVESPSIGITHVKNKGYEFKVMEGIAKLADTSVDLEEVS